MAEEGRPTPEVLIPPAKRAELQTLILAKPQARYIVPTAVAIGNRIGGVFAAVSLANRYNYVLPDDELKQLINAVKSEADGALSPIGVTSTFTVTQTAGSPLSVTTTIAKGTANASFTFVFEPSTHDFSPNWSEMLSIARARWEKYKKTLTEEDVRAIFELAKQGYRNFLTGNSAAEQKAKIKHALAMEGLKAVPLSYMLRLNPEKYEAGYANSADKYRIITQNIALPALLYGFEYAKTVVQVL